MDGLTENNLMNTIRQIFLVKRLFKIDATLTQPCRLSRLERVRAAEYMDTLTLMYATFRSMTKSRNRRLIEYKTQLLF